MSDNRGAAWWMPTTAWHTNHVVRYYCQCQQETASQSDAIALLSENCRITPERPCLRICRISRPPSDGKSFVLDLLLHFVFCVVFTDSIVESINVANQLPTTHICILTSTDHYLLTKMMGRRYGDSECKLRGCKEIKKLARRINEKKKSLCRINVVFRHRATALSSFDGRRRLCNKIKTFFPHLLLLNFASMRLYSTFYAIMLFSSYLECFVGFVCSAGAWFAWHWRPRNNKS